MDVAAQEITKLVQRILPERPHHLSVSATCRYPVPPSLWPNTSPLQYTTYVSEADRGILLTRPYFDIQLEPDVDVNAKLDSSKDKRSKALADAASLGGTPIGANSKGEAKKPVTKMSFKDYQQSKNQKKNAGSPPDTLSASKRDAELSKSEEAMASVERQHLPPKADFNGDRKLHSPSKSPRRAPSPSAAESRKRVADNNDSASRPHKRSRSDTSMSSNSPPAASSSSKFPNRIHDPPSPLDLDNRRDDRSKPTTNGLSSQSKQRDKYRDRDGDRDRDRDRDYGRYRDRDRDRDRDRERNRDRDHDRDRDRDRGRDRDRDRDRDRSDTNRRSPLSPSAPKTNGHKYHINRERDRSRERSPDDDRGPLSALPPILSPLHFTPDRGSGSTKQPRSSNDSAGTSGKGSGKAESGKKEDSPFHIPPLLSPTLPAIVEQELSRLKNTPAKDYESKPKSGQEPAHSVSAGKKPSRPAADTEMDNVAFKEAPHKDSHRVKEEPQKETKETVTQPPSKRSLVIVLKYKKKNVKRVLRLLALQQTPLKAPLKQTERSVSIENTPSPAQTTKKRPVPSDISTSELLPPPSATSSSFKHPKTVAEKSVSASRTSVGPATPIKSTPMARGTSNNSQVLTPGDSTSYTPRSSERPATSQGDHTSNITVSDYRRRYDTYLRLGTKLKHDRDAIVKSKMPNGSAKVDGSSAPSLGMTLPEKKLVAALSLEMVMSYLIAFKSLNQGRHLERKPGDVTVWERLMPHFAELRSHTRHFRPLEAMTVQLRAICFEQMMASFVGHDAETVAAKLMVATKQRIDAWTEVANCVDAVNDSSLKVVVGPWLSIEDTVRIMLPTVRRWNERENAGWEQELQPPK